MTNLPYKSKFEKDFAALYPELQYEVDVIPYTVVHNYHPDWKIKENTYIETKGLWKSADRAKHKYLREQNPDLVIYMVFQNPNNKLSRASKTTYGEYCDKHGIKWATINDVPDEWFL